MEIHLLKDQSGIVQFDFWVTTVFLSKPFKD